MKKVKDLTIQDEKKPKIVSSYKFDIEFMVGDCDGEEHVITLVSEEEFKDENNRKDFFKLIECTESLIFIENIEGRGATCDKKEFLDFYSGATHFKEVVSNFNEPTNKYDIYIPSQSPSDYYLSLYKYTLTYIDSDGDEHPVTINYEQ